MDFAEEFARIFAGLDRVYGTYHIPEDAVADERGKIKGRAITKDAPVTVDLWRGHIAGTEAIGITPIRDDHTCVFGAIDVDDYTIDLDEWVRMIHELNLPLVLCRTKSGGAHLYAFTREPVKAGLMHQKLRDWATAFGLDDRTEIFPKQDKLEIHNEHGSWINMPYFGGEPSTRYALGKRALSMTEFVQYVEHVRIADAPTLREIEPAKRLPPRRNGKATKPVSTGSTKRDSVEPPPEAPPHELLPEAPPCLVTLAEEKFPEGSRNNGFFSLCVYFRKAYPEGVWQKMAMRANQEMMAKPLPEPEAVSVIHSIERKRYGYKCKDQPIFSVCDKKLCAKREHGVSPGVSLREIDVEFGDITKLMTKPVTWMWSIDSEIVDFSTEDLINQKAFQGKMIEVLNRWPPMIKPAAWRNLIQDRIANAKIEEVPDDATAEGQLWDFLNRFCTSRVAGKSLDELLMGRPYTDQETMRSYFVASDFVSYLIQHRFPNRVSERLVYLWLKDRNLLHHRSELKGKLINYWSVPAFTIQTKSHDVPREEPKDAF